MENDYRCDNPDCHTIEGTDFFQYYNANPAGVEDEEDDIVQILSYMMPEKSIREIMEIILKEETETGMIICDSKAKDKILKKYLKMKKVQFPKGSTVKWFLNNWKDILPETGTAIFRSGNEYHLFNMANGKVYERRPLYFEWTAYHAYIVEVRK